MIIETNLDKLIYKIVQECNGVTPPLNSGEIEQIAIEQIEAKMRQQIKSTLDRLVEQGRLTGRSETGAPQRYSLATAA